MSDTHTPTTTEGAYLEIYTNDGPRRRRIFISPCTIRHVGLELTGVKLPVGLPNMRYEPALQEDATDKQD